MSGLFLLLQVASTVRLASLFWLLSLRSFDLEKVLFVVAKAVSSLHRALCIVALNRLHLNLNCMEARYLASIMFQQLYGGAVRTLQSWAMDIFQVRRLPR